MEWHGPGVAQAWPRRGGVAWLGEVEIQVVVSETAADRAATLAWRGPGVRGCGDDYGVQ